MGLTRACLTSSLVIMSMLMLSAQTLPASGARTLFQVDFALLDVTWGQKGSILEPEPGDTAVPLIIGVTPSAMLRSSILIAGLSGTIMYDTPYITSQDGSSSERDYVEGTYMLGQRIEFHFTANLDENMPVGTYTSYLTIEFLVTEAITDAGDAYQLKVPLKIFGRADLNYRLEPSTLTPGAFNTVNIVLENNGSGAAYSLETTFKADKTTIVEGVSSWTASSLPSKDVIRLPFTLYVHPDLENRVTEAVISTTYRSQAGNTLAVQQDVFFSVEARKNLFQQSSSAMLTAGTENRVLITLSYKGQTTLGKVEFTLTSIPPAAITSDSRWTVYDVQPGDTIPLGLDIFTDRNAHSTTVTTTIQYYDPMGALIKETVDQSFPVEAASEDSTKLSFTSFNVSAGGANDFRLILKNIRNSTIRNVDIESQLSSPFTVLGTNIWNFNEIATKQEVELPLTLYAPASSLGVSGSLTITVRYSDQWGTLSTDIHRIGFTSSRSLLEGAVTIRASALELTAGSNNVLNITLANGRNFELRDVQVTARTVDPLRITGVSSWTFPSIKPADQANFSLQLSIPSQASGGAGVVTFALEYSDSFGEKTVESQSLGFSVPESILATSPLTVEVLDATMKNGVLNKLTLTVKNSGDSVIRDIDMKISSTAPAAVIGSEGRWIIRSLGAGQVQRNSLTLFVPDGVSSSLTLSLDITYSDALGQVRGENRKISLVIGAASTSPLLVTALGGEMIGGILSNYTLLVSNTADHVITDTEIIIGAPATVTIVGTEGRWPLGRLSPGEVRKVNIPVFASDKSVGSKGTLELSLAYTDQGILRSEMKSVDFTIVGLMDLRVTDIVFSPHPLPAGSKFTVSATLFNAGNVDAKAVTVGFNVSSPFLRETAATEALIGDVSVGSQVPFSLTGIIAANAKPGSYPLTLTVLLKDDTGVWRNINATEEADLIAPESIQEQESTLPFISVPSILIGLAFGIIITAVILRIIRRRR